MITRRHRHRILVVKHAHLSTCWLLLVFWWAAACMLAELTIVVLSIVVLVDALRPVIECHSLNRKCWLADCLVTASLGEAIYTVHILLCKIFSRVE